ncbi:hypothetical protein MKK88_02660 [Methylobacterium sp. E-005]|uniref:hypothetical protein n=1 Tax=Methylobacterium sp. E-005 TaxID=2836549 RepID=UPI001FBB400C|nr:hypothetical protein [Methylobacterium sp. E-005]MCJ2084896.1 hypothetical protein [Methylobacterium sp. E-005]
MTKTVDPRAASRVAIIARYGSEAAALLPCDRERTLRELTWHLVMPGNPETGPSLMGWRDGAAGTMPPEVRRDVSTAIRRPAAPDDAAAEAAYWTERAATREALDAGPLPVWVRARQAILEEVLGQPQVRTPPDPPPPVTLPAPAQADDAGRDHVEPTESDGDQEQDDDAGPDQAGQAKRTREEAREAVRALLGKDLTDREIARRVGVSPTTVAAVRKASA